jgi:hypothetical protein
MVMMVNFVAGRYMRIDCCEGPGTGRAESCDDDRNNSSAVGAGLMYGFGDRGGEFGADKVS